MATGFDNLLKGYTRFRDAGWPRQRARWDELTQGQSPKVMVIACSDSRVDPATIFDSWPGEMFVVRNVAALVPPFETGGGHHGVSAALEFAVTQLEVEEIVILGHEFCGGVKAALQRSFATAAPGEGGFIADWIALLDTARDRVVAEHGDGAEALLELEYESVRMSLANLRGFPFVPQREAAGRLKLHGAIFSISDGVLRLLDENTGVFAPAS